MLQDPGEKCSNSGAHGEKGEHALAWRKVSGSQAGKGPKEAGGGQGCTKGLERDVRADHVEYRMGKGELQKMSPER